MKRILIFIGLIAFGFTASAQFQTTDSLVKFINRWIRNSAVESFQNLRLNTAMIGMTRFIDSAYGGQIASIDQTNDSTFKIVTLGQDTLTTIIIGRHWTLQQVLANGSTLTSNHTITLADSLSFVSGKVLLDQLRLTGITTQSDTTLYKPLARDALGNVVGFDRWPGSGSGGGSSSAGNSYYVAEDGLSSGQGSTSATAINLTRLNALASGFTGGEKIYLKAGDTLRGQLTIKSGTYIGRYDTGHAPVIAGTIRASSLTWTQDGDVWSAPYPTRIGRVLLNGIPQRTAQSAYYAVTSRPASNQVAASTATGLGGWVSDAEIVSKEYNFRFKYNDVTAYNTVTGAFTLNADIGIAVGYSFKLINHPELITADGDWAWVDGVVYYRPPGNVNPNTLNVEVSAYDDGLTFEDGGSNFTVEGVTFYGQALQGIKANKTSAITIKNCNFYKQLDAGIFFDDSCSNLSVTYCKFDSIGSSGILGGMGIRNFVFDHLDIRHIAMQADPPFSRNNDIAFRNGVNGHGIMLFPNGDNGYITNCTVDSVAYIGIRADASNTLIQNNRVSNFSLRQNDAGGIYTWGNETYYLASHGWRRTRNVTIANNVVWNGIGGNEGGPAETSHAMGIYLDNGTTDTRVIGNTTYNNTGSGIFIGSDAKGNEITGNVSYGNNEAQIRIYNLTTDGAVVSNNVKIKNNILASLKSTSRCFLILNGSGGSFNPFDSGYCLNNTLVSPYTNNIIQTETTTYTLATGRTAYGVNFGQQDSYSATFVSDSIARVNVPIDVNTATESRWSVMPENFRSTVNKYSNAVLSPGLSNVWVTASRDLIVNHNNGPTTFGLSKDNTEKFLFGVANAADQFIVGAVSDDIGLRTAGGKLLFSCDVGVTATATITPTRVGIGTTSPTTLLDVQANSNTFERINIRNLNANSSAGSMIQVLNNNSFGLQAGIGSSAYSSGFIGTNDAFIQANTNAGSNFNIMSVATGQIRFGQFIGASVQEVARFNSSGEFQLGSTTDQGAYKLQNTGGFYQNGAVAMNLGSDATGDMYYRNSGGTLSRLGIGADGKVLKVTSGLPSWEDETGGGGTLSGSGTSGRAAYWDGTSSLASDANFLYSTSNGGTLSIGTTNTQGHLNLGGNKTLFGGTSGVQSYFATATYNDASTVASGTSSSYIINYIASPTVTATNTDVTFPSITTLAVDGPIASTNATITNRYAIMTGSNGHVKVQGNTEVDGALLAGGAQYNAVTTITSTSTLATNVHIIEVDATSGNITITLPAASSVFTGGRGIHYILTRVDNSGNTITIQRAGSDTISGGTTFTLTAQYEVKELQAVSTNRWIVKG